MILGKPIVAKNDLRKHPNKGLVESCWGSPKAPLRPAKIRLGEDGLREDMAMDKKIPSKTPSIV